MSVSPARRSAAFAVAVLVPMVVVFAPIIFGTDLLYLRDVASVHLPLEIERARLVAAGETPFIATARAGGQALLGNLNASPLYPTKWLAGVLGADRALMAHFWIHLLAAGPLFAQLGRARGLSVAARWVGATCWVSSGWALSHLAFANLVPFLALAPAFAAALSAALKGSRAGRLALGVTTALLLLAGDPIVALLVVFAGLALCLTGLRLPRKHTRDAPLEPASTPLPFRPTWACLIGVAGALVAGVALAAPQLVEFARALGASSRAASPTSQLVASFDPRQVVDLLVPFPFGQPDLVGAGAFWGHAFHQGFPPFFFTLFPGAIALGLALAGVRRAAKAEWLLAGVGLFVALGSFNPVVSLLAKLPGLEVLRYPIKAWLLVALALALFAGRAIDAPQRAWRVAVDITLAVTATLWLLLVLQASGTTLVRWFAPADAGWSFLDGERIRIAGKLLIVLVAGLGGRALLTISDRRPRWLVLLAGWMIATQLVLLAPAFPTLPHDALATPSPLLDFLPADAVVVQGDALGLFGSPPSIAAPTPDTRGAWLFVRAARQLYPLSGVRHGLRYELDHTPEGLGSWLSRLSEAAVKHADDTTRLRLLRAWGVQYLLLSRPLESRPPAPSLGAELVTTDEAFGASISLYHLTPTAPAIGLYTQVFHATDPRQALDRLSAADFDPRNEVVLAGSAAAPQAKAITPPQLVTFRESPNALHVVVESEVPATLVWQRAWLPHYRARIDGVAAPIAIANLHRIAVQLPAGRHTVEVAVAQGRWRWGLLLSVLGAIALLIASWGPRSHRQRPLAEVGPAQVDVDQNG